MQESIQSLSQRAEYEPSLFTRFLWWLSTAEKELVIDCKVDRNRYAITGMTVLGTWLFATLAWTYFFSTIVTDFWIASLLGIFMGGIILGIDRALIKGITASNKNKITPLLFRAILAITIGTFMAQPALLYLFDKEVHLQISLDNEGKKRLKLQQLDSLYAAQKTELINEKNALQLQLNNKYNEVSNAREAFIAETDGTGGSGKIGLRDIAKAKQNEYSKLDNDYTQLNGALQPRLHAIDSTLATIETAKQAEQKKFEALLNDGFLVRIEALQHLVENNSAMAFRYYLLVILLVLIELMPVIAKTILPVGAYDEKVRLQEEMEREIAARNTRKETDLKELYNQLAFEQDSEFIKDFFEQAKQQRKEKMLEKLGRWKKSEGRSFDSVWTNLKKDFLTKQEN
ncbi:DUF4407 domain-containing protein [Panacibacter ginsenosidivorans]|uniref:DUF4407 domain-containing protein n=1 Tax=Panacibacter ginsenosidivorans TaxID=1813871 RepID=A0A5B8V9V5_9BACT|nr:DUF4407 domain-containing protein [Panacibacter ginsenosidivorans]QEC68039.1 DUF4407 domain-containing protein [Panacibacter ginsenosidivorans]